MNDTMHDLACQRIQVDEIWSFVGKKQRRLTAHDNPTTTGDMWTFVAIDADSKLIPCYRIGKRTGREAQAFMADLEPVSSNRVQLSSDALAAYVEAVELAFGSNVDYGQMVKSYEADPIGLGRYSALSRGLGRADADHRRPRPRSHLNVTKSSGSTSPCA